MCIKAGGRRRGRQGNGRCVTLAACCHALSLLLQRLLTLTAMPSVTLATRPSHPRCHALPLLVPCPLTCPLTLTFMPSHSCCHALSLLLPCPLPYPLTHVAMPSHSYFCPLTSPLTVAGVPSHSCCHALSRAPSLLLPCSRPSTPNPFVHIYLHTPTCV